MSNLASVFGLFYHGSCRYCKHFHKNHEFHLPSSGGRVKCARCERDLFALGRADTQYTLASVDSIPLSLVSTDAAVGRAGCSNSPQSHSRIMGPFRSDQTTRQPQQLSNVQATRSVHTQTYGVETHQVVTQSTAPVDGESSQSPTEVTSSIPIGALQRLPYHITLLGATDYVNLVGQRFAPSLFQSPREYAIFGWRFIIHPPANPADDQVAAAVDTNLQPDAASTGEPTANYSGSAETVGRAGTSADAPSAPDTSAADFYQAGQSMNSDRLKSIRREKTLRNTALQQLRCRCTDDCHCVPHLVEPQTTESESGDFHSSSPRTPPNADDIPFNSVIDRLGVGPSLYLSHLGSQFYNQYEPAGSDLGSSDSGSSDSSGHSLAISQSSTLASNRSLDTRLRRPPMASRSRSMPF